MIEKALYALLIGDAGVAAIAGNRVMPAPAKKDTAFPRITYQRVNTARDYLLNGPDGDPMARVQIDCWATTYAQAKALAAAVVAALDWDGELAGMTVATIQIADERDSYEAPEAAGETPTYGVGIDVEIHFEE